MDSLLSYIPMDHRQAIATGGRIPTQARGAVLFVDVAGFTRLSNILVQELGAERGAEELTHQINRVYARLTVEVHRYRGSIVVFAGDALTCWFNHDDSHRAVACAMNMQMAVQELANLSTPQSIKLDIQVKAAVTVGEVRRFPVGKQDIQILEAFSGQVLDRVATAEKLSNPGEVIVGTEVVRAWGEHMRVKQWRISSTDQAFAVVEAITLDVSPDPWPELPPLNPDLVRSWLLPTIYHRIQRGEGNFLCELRPTVALFLKFDGIDYDHDDEAEHKLNTYICWVQSVLADYDGYLLNLIIGDKGSYFYADFGALVAHEDDVARALTAALLLRSPPPYLQTIIKTTQIGISQGQMRVGIYGSEGRRSYGVYGRDANIAARLMSKARAGQILAPAPMLKSVASDFNVQDLGHMSLRGLHDSLPVVSVLERSSSPQWDAVSPINLPLVGRTGEQAVLKAQIQQLTQSTGSLVLVEGEAGIGKSRLLEDSITLGHELKLNQLLGRADALEKRTPYYLWQPIVSRILQLELTTNNLEQRHQAVLAWIGRQPEEIALQAPLLNSVLSLALPDTEVTQGLTGQERADQTHQLVAHLIERYVEKLPTLLLIDDAQWMDSASWSLLVTVSQKLRNLLLIVATRPLPKTLSQYQQLLTHSRLHHLRLAELADQDNLALVCQQLGVASLPEPLIELIQRYTQGNPFFSQELANWLQAQKIIQVVDGVCHLTNNTGKDLSQIPIPSTSQGLVNSRIDQLSAEQQLAIKVASVIGQVFPYAILHNIYPIHRDRDHLPSCLDILATHNLMQVLPQNDESIYTFRHVIIQNAAYNRLLFSQRRQLHEAIALWYEQTYSHDLTPRYSLLAYHWSKAENAPKAVEYFEKAGQYALTTYSNPEALVFFKSALKWLQKLPDTREYQLQELRLRVAIATPITVVEGYGSPELIKTFKRAQKLTQMLGKVPNFIQMLWGLFAAHVGQADLNTALELAKQLYDAADLAQISDFYVISYQALGATYLYYGEQTAAQHHLEQGLNCFIPDHHRELQVQYGQDFEVASLNLLSQVLCWRGFCHQGRQRIEQSLALATQLNHIFSLCLTRNYAVQTYHFLGDLDQVSCHAAHLLADAQELGFVFFLPIAQLFHGWSLFKQGNITTGLEQMQTAVQSYLEQGPRLGQPYLVGVVAEACGENGQFKEGLRLIDQALKLSCKTDDRCWNAELYRLKGEYLLNLSPQEWSEIYSSSCPTQCPADCSRNLLGSPSDNPADAPFQVATCLFQKAIAIARQQGARSLEWRAIISLCRLWHQSTHPQHHTEARTMLALILRESEKEVNQRDWGTAQTLWLMLNS